MAADPARGQLVRENRFFLSLLFASESLVSRVRGSAAPSRFSPLILHTQAESGAYLRESHNWNPPAQGQYNSQGIARQTGASYSDKKRSTCTADEPIFCLDSEPS